MKTTLKERVRKRLTKFGRKNKICRILVMPALILTMSFFNLIACLKGNCKKLATMAITLCLFVVYSSFSFPMFIIGDGAQNGYRLETESDVELAPEADIDLREAALLVDRELEEYGEEDEGYYDLEELDAYNTLEFLAALEGYGKQNEADRTDGGESGEEEDQETEQDGQVSAGEVVFSKDDWRLLLVNKQHSIPEDYSFTIASFMNFKCDERILDDLADMFQAAKDDGIYLVIRSPYRSHEQQVANFDRKIKLYMGKGMSYMEAYQIGSQAVTVPGNSEHELGLALDITCEGFPGLLQSFIETDAGKWLAEKGCEYGFIVRYPKGKEYITGIMYEPWHMRYVGKEAATYITEKGICLEEFWEEL